MITNSTYGVSLLMLCINPMYVCTHTHTYPHPHRPTAPPPPPLTITDHSRCQHRYLLVTQLTHSDDVEHLRHKLVSLVLLHHLRTRTGFRFLGVTVTDLEGRGGEGRGGVEEWRSWWGDKIQMLYELCTYIHSQPENHKWGFSTIFYITLHTSITCFSGLSQYTSCTMSLYRGDTMHWQQVPSWRLGAVDGGCLIQ